MENKKVANMNYEEIKKLAEDNAPIFHFHPNEPYFPSSAEWFLKRANLCKRDFSTSDGSKDEIFASGDLDTNFPTDALISDQEDFLTYIELSTDPKEVGQEQAEENFKKKYAYYLEVPSANWSGDLASAKTYVNVFQTKNDPETSNDDHIEWDDFIGINYWLFYPYNGPGTMKLDLLKKGQIDMDPHGIHSGDWERVTFVIRKTDRQLSYAIFEAHGDAELIEASELERDKDGRVNVYASFHGHGFYPKTGENYTSVGPKLFGNSFTAKLLNLCATGGKSLDGKTNNEILNVDLPDIDATDKPRPVWLDYPYRWGRSVLLVPERKLGENILKAIIGDEFAGDIVWLGDKISDLIDEPVKMLNAKVKTLGGDSDKIKDQTYVPNFDNLDLVEYITASLNYLAYRDTLESNGPPGPQNKPSFRGEGQDFMTHGHQDDLLVTGIRAIFEALNMEVNNDRYTATGDRVTLDLRAEGNIWTAGNQPSMFARMAFTGKNIDRFTDINTSIELQPTTINKLMAQVKIESDNNIADHLGSATEQLLKGIGTFVDEIVTIKSVKFSGTARQFYDGQATMSVDLAPLAGIRSYFEKQNRYIPLDDFPSIPETQKIVTITTTGIDIRQIVEATAALYSRIKQEVGPYVKYLTEPAEVVIDALTDFGDYTITSATDFSHSFVSAIYDFKDFIEDTGDMIEGWLGLGSSKPEPYTPPAGTVPIAYLLNENTRKTLKYSGGSDTGNAIGVTSNPNIRDFWVLLPYKDKTHYVIKSMEGETYLSNKGNRADGAPIMQVNVPASGALWSYRSVKHDGENYFELTNKESGHRLAVINGKVVQNKNGTNSRWKGGKTDYMRPIDILAGKGKVIALLDEHSHDGKTGKRAYLRYQDYNRKAFASIFPPGELSAIFFRDSSIELTLKDKSGKSYRTVTRPRNNGTVKMNDIDFNDKTHSIEVRKKDTYQYITPGHYFITAQVHGAMRIEVGGYSKAESGNVQLWEHNNDTPSQIWVVENAGGRSNCYYLKNAHSGLYLSMNNDNPMHATNVEQKSKHTWLNDSRFAWMFLSLEDDYVKIVSAQDVNFCLSIANASSSNGANIIMRPAADRHGEQNFKLRSAPVVMEIPDSFFTFKNKVTGMYLSNLDQLDGVNASSVYISQKDSLSEGCYWGFTKAPNGYYYIKSKMTGRHRGLYTHVNGYISSGLVGEPISKGVYTFVQLPFADNKSGMGLAGHAEWAIEDMGNQRYRFRNKRTGRYIDNYGETRTGTHMRLTDKPGDGALWTSNAALHGAKEESASAAKITPGIYYITAKHSSMVIEVASHGKNDKDNIQQWSKTGTPSQRWILEPVGDDKHYYLKNSNSGKYMDRSNDVDKINGAQVYQYTRHGRENQQWFFEETGGGFYRIRSKAAPSSSLDVKEISTSNGANIQMYYGGGGDNQKFKLDKAG